MSNDAPSHPVVLGVPQFTRTERDRRYAAVRALMRERDLAALIIPHSTGDWDNYQPDTRYLTCIGGGGTATALVFPLEGEPIAAVREARRIAWWRASQDWVADVRSPPGFKWAPFFADALRERGLANARIGIVGLSQVLREPDGIVLHGEFNALQQLLPGARFESATDLIYRVRKRKSAEEIAITERAQACADAIADALRRTARPGVPEHTVYAAMVEAGVRAGGELPSMLLFSADERIWQTQVVPTFRNLGRNDVIMIEAEPKYYGYMAQAVDTVSMRALSAEERRLIDISFECFQMLVAELRPGRSYAEMIGRFEAFVRAAGALPGRTMGHGLGLGQDGPLTVPGGSAGGLIVEAGDCLVIKPWVANPADTISVRIGGTVVVEASGARRLGRSELQPLVVEQT